MKISKINVDLKKRTEVDKIIDKALKQPIKIVPPKYKKDKF